MNGLTSHFSSCIYTGSVSHRRLEPRKHQFTYKLFMAYIDLAELPLLQEARIISDRFSAVSFRRSDYMEPHDIPLHEAVRLRVEEHTGQGPKGPIRMLTHLRYLGFCFNPVTFYYCFDETESLQAVVAEITNTPWNQRHSYVLQPPSAGNAQSNYQFVFKKDFHVSPFMPMNQDYQWVFTVPGEQLRVYMQNFQDLMDPNHGDFQTEKRVFEVALGMERKPITCLHKHAVRHYPLMTLRVVGAIYYQALRLVLKRIPFHSHPQPEHEFFSRSQRSAISWKKP